MAAERFSARDETDGRREDELRGDRRDWRRWWDDKTEALDPEKWKAMASAWSCLWQDAAKGTAGDQAAGHGDQDLPLLAQEETQASGDQVQTLRHVAGCGAGVGPIELHVGSGRNGRWLPQRVSPRTGSPAPPRMRWQPAF